MTHRIAILSREYPYVYDSPVWDAYEQLKLAGNVVELLDETRFPGLLKADGTYNEELLGTFIETFKPDRIAYEHESVDEILAGLEPNDAPAPRRFVVFGYVGKDNFGDELLFSVIKRELMARYPGCHIALIGHDPVRALQRHGIVSVQPFDKAAGRAMLNGADALIYMAGLIFDQTLESTSGLIDLFQNPYGEIAGQAAFVQLAHMCDVPSVFLGIGAGPLQERDAQRLVRLESLCSPLYIARDDHTADLFKEAGVDPQLIHTTADTAFMIDPEGYLCSAPAGPALNGIDYVVVSLRDDPGNPPDFHAQIARALDSLYEKRSIVPVFLDFAPEDRLEHDRVAQAMVHGDASLSFDTLDTDEALRILAHARLVLGMRLHASILACLFGVPCVGLNYNDKVEAFYKQVGATDCLAGLGVQGDDLAGAFERALDRDWAQTRKQVEENRARAREGFELLFGIVDSRTNEVVPQHRYPRIVANDVLAMFAAQAECAQLRAELDARSRERDDLANQLEHARNQLASAQSELAGAKSWIDELQSSTTWKVGRIATAIPRKLKDIVRGQ